MRTLLSRRAPALSPKKQDGEAKLAATTAFTALAIALLSAAVLTTSPSRAQSASSGSGAPLKIGFSIEAMNGERWQTDLEAFERRAKELGAEVVSADAKGDDDVQFRQVREMIRGGIKTLVLLPHDAGKAARMVDAAKAAGVWVISYDRLVQSESVDLYITFDRQAIGRMQAEYLVAHAPKGNYVLIGGSPSDPGAVAIHEAQMKVLQPYVDRGDLHVIADSYTKEWLPSEAYLFTLNTIEKLRDPSATGLRASDRVGEKAEAGKGEIAAIVASNDGMAGGAIQALTEHKLAGKVLVSGQDADLAAVIAIARGDQAMTVYKPITMQAVTAADEAVRLAKDPWARGLRTSEKPGADGMTTGAVKVPRILLQPVLVTRENIKATVVKDGFQTLARINQGLAEGQRIE